MVNLLLLLLYIGAGWSAPADEPIHVELPVYDQPQVGSDLSLTQEIQPENYPGGEPLANSGQTTGNFATHKVQAITNLFDNKAKASFDFEGPFAAPVTTRETALLETEGYGSKTLSVKENIQNVVADLFQPQPLLDTISESEKYGNTGDKFYTAGKALVGGAESISNLINSVLEVPASIIKKISCVTTEKLNNLGGRLIGL